MRSDKFRGDHSGNPSLCTRFKVFREAATKQHSKQQFIVETIAATSSPSVARNVSRSVGEAGNQGVSSSTLTVIDFHIETVRVQLPINHVTASLESALSGFNRTIDAFRTFDCDCFLHALELVAVRTADVLEKSYEIRMLPTHRNRLGVQRLRSNWFFARRELHYSPPKGARGSDLGAVQK
jgi:hypothetical protein